MPIPVRLVEANDRNVSGGLVRLEDLPLDVVFVDGDSSNVAGGVVAVAPPLYLDFRKGILDSRITYTNGTNQWYFDRTGTLQVAAPNVPCFAYDPATLSPLGLQIFEQRTNEIRNNTMQGASAPSTLPTNWNFSGTGVTAAVVGTGTTAGIEYIDIRLSGTTGGTSGFLAFETVTGVAWTNTQVFTSSSWIQIVSGSTTNISSIALAANGYDAGSAFIGGISAGTQSAAVSSVWQRITRVLTGANPSLAFGRPGLALSYSNGAAIDITLRIGLPQLEQRAFATPPIKTTGSAVTVNASTDSSTAQIPSGAGTVVLQARTAAGAGTQTLWTLNDGTADNRIYIQRNSSNEIHAIVVNGGVTQADLNLGTVTANTDFKVAFAWTANDFEGRITGGSAVTDTSGTVPTVTTRNIGHNYTNANHWNSTVARVSEYMRRLPSAQLAAQVA